MRGPPWRRLVRTPITAARVYRGSTSNRLSTSSQAPHDQSALRRWIRRWRDQPARVRTGPPGGVRTRWRWITGQQGARATLRIAPDAGGSGAGERERVGVGTVCALPYRDATSAYPILARDTPYIGAAVRPVVGTCVTHANEPLSEGRSSSTVPRSWRHPRATGRATGRRRPSPSIASPRQWTTWYRSPEWPRTQPSARRVALPAAASTGRLDPDGWARPDVASRGKAAQRAMELITRPSVRMSTATFIFDARVAQADCSGWRRNRRTVRRPGKPAPRRPATVAGIGITDHVTPSPGEAAFHAGIALPVPLILAAAQPLPLINHCCGGAATM